MSTEIKSRQINVNLDDKVFGGTGIVALFKTNSGWVGIELEGVAGDDSNIYFKEANTQKMLFGWDASASLLRWRDMVGNADRMTLSQGGDLTLNGGITIANDINKRLTLGRQDNTFEGGEILFTGADTYVGWYQDVYKNQMRFFPSSAVTQEVRMFNNGAGTLNLWVEGDVSALTFTDRTPFYDGDALEEIKAIKGKDGKIDHETLPKFAQKKVKNVIKGKGKNAGEKEETGRDLGAMISILTKAVQQLTEEVEFLKSEINKRK